MSASTKPPVELSLVMPVYDEEEAIEAVVQEWTTALERLGASWELLAYDDGSRDRSASILERLAAEVQEVRVRRQANRGHGPTVLRGYREAVGEWILQVDSDGEVAPECLQELWDRRTTCDALIGIRLRRRVSFGRRSLSWLSRLALHSLFGSSVKDPNCPLRLMRRSWLAPMLSYVPDDTFSPNVALSGLALASGARVAEHPVVHRGRLGGASTLGGLRLLYTAPRVFFETRAIGRRFRSDRGTGTAEVRR